jgi:hypothetical protein
MITSPLPVATTVQSASFDPTVAAGRPLINTDLEPVTMGATCGGHFLAGRRCLLDTSPTLAAPRPLINTSEDAVAMTYALQCGTPASPLLAAAGMFYLHQSVKLELPRINFFVISPSVRARRNFGTELYHVIKLCRYVLVVVKFVQHTRDHDHETMWHASQ